MDSTSSAVYDTMDYWDSQAKNGVIRIGISRDAEDRATVRYVKRNGIKVGFLAYTYGLNGARLPDSNPDLVSLIDKDTMKKELAAAKENAMQLSLSCIGARNITRRPTRNRRISLNF